MLNRTVILAPVPHHTERVTEHVHEHRAPTDESVRLLAEMEAAARAKVIKSVNVGDTTFECVVHFQRSFASDTTTLLAIFSLNGKKLTAEHTFSPRNRVERPTAALAALPLAALRDAIALKIANEILTPALHGMEGRI